MRPVLWQPRDLGLVEIRADLGAARQQHEIPERQPRPPGVRPRLVHHPRDADVIHVDERWHGVHDNGIPIL